jgi:hypothetical protein
VIAFAQILVTTVDRIDEELKPLPHAVSGSSERMSE